MTRYRKGFSLIETVLALGIVATLLTVMLGLLPAGLTASHKASQSAMERRILEHLRTLSARGVSAGELYFNSQGLPVPSDAEDRPFTAKLGTIVPAVLPGDEAPTVLTVPVELRDQASVSTHTLVLSPSR